MWFVGLRAERLKAEKERMQEMIDKYMQRRYDERMARERVAIATRQAYNKWLRDNY